jgi:hypothetical protein
MKIAKEIALAGLLAMTGGTMRVQPNSIRAR